MNFLTAIVPSLREIRGPLLSGYVYMLSIWLALGDRIPERDTLNPGSLGDSLARAADFVGPAGVLAAVSVVAYFVGSLLGDLQMAILDNSLELKGPTRVPSAAKVVGATPSDPASAAVKPVLSERGAEKIGRLNAEGRLRLSLGSSLFALAFVISLRWDAGFLRLLPILVPLAMFGQALMLYRRVDLELRREGIPA